MSIELTDEAKAFWDGSLIIRKARKAHTCHTYWMGVVRRRKHPGFGPAPAWTHACFEGEWMCLGQILPGDQYVECTDEAHAFQSGHRYCEHCAKNPKGPLGDISGDIERRN